MLEGRNVNLRIVEKEDLPLITEWLNDPDFFSYAPFPQRSRTEVENQYDRLSPESKWFLMEKKDGSKIGLFYHSQERNLQEIGYALLPRERRKGYGTEAVSILVDCLFFTREIMRIQAKTDVRNKASQRS